MRDTFDRWNARPLGKYATRKADYPTDPHPWIIKNVAALFRLFGSDFDTIIEVGAWQCHSAEVLRKTYGKTHKVVATEIDARKVAEASEQYPSLTVLAMDAATVAEKYADSRCCFIAHNVLTHVPRDDLEAFFSVVSRGGHALLHKTIGLANYVDAEAWTHPEKEFVNYYNFPKISRRFGLGSVYQSERPYQRDSISDFQENLCYFPRAAYETILISPKSMPNSVAVNATLKAAEGAPCSPVPDMTPA